MVIDQKLLDELSVQAKANQRLRQNYDLRTSPEDGSQRMLNALEPGTIMPIHRHTGSTETMVMVRGSLKEFFYDNDGNLTDTIHLQAGGENPVLQIPVGQWHSLEVLEEGTVIFEAKNGKYEAMREEDVMKHDA